MGTIRKKIFFFFYSAPESKGPQKFVFVLKTRRKKIFFFFNSAPESFAPQQILFLYLKRNRRSRIFLFFFFSRRRRIFGTFTLWSRIEKEEYFLSASFQEKKKKNIFLLNTKYSTSRKGVVPLRYPSLVLLFPYSSCLLFFQLSQFRTSCVLNP